VATLILLVVVFVVVRSLSQSLAALDRRVADLEGRVAHAGTTPSAAPARPPAPALAAATPKFEHDPPSPRSVSAPIPVQPQPVPLASIAHASDVDLEETIGSKWMLVAGVVVLVLGVGFFVKYAIDNDWVTPAMRVGAGGLAGLALVIIGMRFVRRGYATYGRMLTGGGFAALYLSAYAAFAFYGLIGRTPEFVLLFVVSAAAGVLADRFESAGLALFAVCGGFMVPFFLGGHTDQQVALFSYDVVLVALTLAIAERRDWPLLNLASYGLTIMTISGWAADFYTPAKYVRTEAFLSVFCALFVLILRRSIVSKHPNAHLSTLLLSTGPLLYHAASVGVLSPHSAAFLIYCVLATAVAVAVARAIGRAWLRVLALVLIVLPLFGWLLVHVTPRWLTPALAAFSAVYVIHLAAVLDALVRGDQKLGAADVIAFHLSGLSLFAASYILLNVIHPDLAAPVAFGLALWHLALAGILVGVNFDAALNGVALAGGLLAAALAIGFRGPWLTIGWTVEGTALVWLALRTERRWLHAGALVLVGTGIARGCLANLQTPSIAFVPVMNGAFASGAVATVALYVIGWRYRRAHWFGDDAEAIATVAFVGANVVTLTVVSGQIEAFWQVHQAQHNAELKHQLMLSLTWAAYAAALIAVGMRRGGAALRYLGIFLFALTLGKAFTVDLAALGGIYRVAGFVLIGVLLLWASFLYQRLLKRAHDRGFPESTSMPPPPAEMPGPS